MKRILLVFLPLAWMMTACESGDANGDVDANGEGHLVSICAVAASYTGESAASRATASDMGSRCSFCVFHDGARVKTTEHQEKGIDDDFGTYSLRLDPGTYQLVCVCHNGAYNCTISSAEKVTFRNSHVTDTFCGYTEFTVGDEDVSVSLPMQRVVARVDFSSTSQHPADVAQLKFYYTGGSSTLNPKTGQGCVQSRQSETVDAVTPDAYSFYTFPYQSGSSTLALTVYSLNADGDDIDETAYTGIPVEVNRTTIITTSLFDKHGITVTIPDDAIQWGENINIQL